MLYLVASHICLSYQFVVFYLCSRFLFFTPNHLKHYFTASFVFICIYLFSPQISLAFLWSPAPDSVAEEGYSSPVISHSCRKGICLCPRHRDARSGLVQRVSVPSRVRLNARSHLPPSRNVTEHFWSHPFNLQKKWPSQSVLLPYQSWQQKEKSAPLILLYV